MEPQTDKKHYEFKKYSHPDRWASYFYQLNEVLKFEPDSILEIGVGDKVFSSYIKNNTNINYTSQDIAEDLNPDIVGSITNMPLENNSFSVVCAFEVLEHLPYEEFSNSLKELARVSRKHVLISLPHFGPSVQILLKLPFLHKIQWTFKIPFPKEHTYNGQHYWEIGKKGYALYVIKKDLRKHFKIIKDFVPFENQYHHFFILEKK